MNPLYFIVFGVVWLAIVALAIALCRAAAIGDKQAELSRLPFRPRIVEDEPAPPNSRLNVVSLYDHQRGDAA